MKRFFQKQGSNEWYFARSGIPTASAFDSIITPKGKPSSSQERYMLELLAERIMGKPTHDHMSFWMKRGSEQEAHALNYYRFQREVETEEAGFFTDDSERWGASPDQLVGDSGLLEIKCPGEWKHVGALLDRGRVYEEHKIQCQGQLWVTGREWVDVLSYHPEMPMALIRVERDEPFIDALAEQVQTFSMELERVSAELTERGLITTDRWKSDVRSRSQQVNEEPKTQMDAIDQMRSIMQEVNAR